MQHVIGRDEGYDVNVYIDGGLMTCQSCGRLPGYFPHRWDAESRARYHLSRKHRFREESSDD